MDPNSYLCANQGALQSSMGDGNMHWTETIPSVEIED